jgi:hypothetical protein
MKELDEALYSTYEDVKTRRNAVSVKNLRSSCEI